MSSIEGVIGNRIRGAREAAGMTQEQFGDLLATYLGKAWSRQAVSAAEKGRRLFAASELIACAEVLGCTVHSLISPPAGVDLLAMPSGVELPADRLREAPSTVVAPDTEGLCRSLASIIRAIGFLDQAMGETRREAHRLYDGAILRQVSWSPTPEVVEQARAAIKRVETSAEVDELLERAEQATADRGATDV